MEWIIAYLIIGIIVAIYERNKTGKKMSLILYVPIILLWPLFLLMIIEL